MKNAIIYLHGFNSASLDLSGKLLTSKEKLVVLNEFCQKNQILFYTPNVDYRNFEQLIADLTRVYCDFKDDGYKMLFMGSSLGGFTSEYMAMKTRTTAIMINPAISPAELLTQFIGVGENFETKQAYDWNMTHCEQFIHYENELKNDSGRGIKKIVFVDMGDELIDAQKTLEKYQTTAEVVAFEGGSHGFEHIKEALPIIEKIIFASH
jgi:predicted esterase YcpF (UPF0227 family)